MNQEVKTTEYKYSPIDFIINKIDLDFDLDKETTIVKSTIDITKKSNSSNILKLDGEEIIPTEVYLNDKSILDKITINSNFIEIDVTDAPLNFTIKITNTIKPAQKSSLEGIYSSGETICSQCEANGFRQITYFFDRPDVLTKYKVKITGDKDKYPQMLSNGNLKEKKDIAGNRHTVTWEDPFAKPSYLFALVAGKFHIHEDQFITKSNRKVKLQIFVESQNKDKTGHAMKSLKKAMKWEEDFFNLEYDLDQYMIVAVDFFNMGAMENKGLNVFNSKCILVDEKTGSYDEFDKIEAIIAHEYFHNWTGNRVTCRDWYQLSLKEGLTVFREQLFCSEKNEILERIKSVCVLRKYQFPEDSGATSHPVIPIGMKKIDNFYTPTIYYKGAEIIRMIYLLTGKEKFLKGIKEYIKKHDNKAATCEDFINIMAETSKIDLTQFKLWYHQSGTPKINWTEEHNKEKKQLIITVEQINSPTNDQQQKQSLHIPIEIELISKAGKIIDINSDQIDNNIINLKQDKAKIIINNVPEKPIVAMLGNCSAPVKNIKTIKTEELEHIMTYSNNKFTAWNASQQIALVDIKNTLAQLEQNEDISRIDQSKKFIKAIKTRIEKEKDIYLLNEMLNIPSEPEIYDEVDLIRPKQIHQARNLLIKTTANELKDVFYQTYHEVNKEKNKQNIIYKNTILKFLAYIDDPQIEQIIHDQYHSSINMSESLGALTAANNNHIKIRDELMEDFKQKWNTDSLTIQKWFRFQATIPSKTAIDKMKEIIESNIFNISNPNAVKSLIGSFATENKYILHTDKRAYEFMMQNIIAIQHINPQTAASIIQPIVDWRKYKPAKQEEIKNILIQIASSNNLSKNVYEKIKTSIFN